MPRDAYVNGRYVPHVQAAVHVEDRGYQFADGVYEVMMVMAGQLVDETGHLERLRYSLSELRIAPPLGEASLRLVMRQLIRRNGLRDGSIYLQISRGVGSRDFKFPKRGKSAIVMTTRRMAPLPQSIWDDGVDVITVPDLRWARPDIKSTGLLAQVLAKQAAVEAGAFEAWMVDRDGYVTEGASSNAWIVRGDGMLATRTADRSILKGVTGNAIDQLAGEMGIAIERRAFTVSEAKNAREAFLTSATNFCVPITRIDGQAVGSGRPGELARTLKQQYLHYAQMRQDTPFHWQA